MESADRPVAGRIGRVRGPRGDLGFALAGVDRMCRVDRVVGLFGVRRLLFGLCHAVTFLLICQERVLLPQECHVGATIWTKVSVHLSNGGLTL